jgi:hypothetical protein
MENTTTTTKTDTTKEHLHQWFDSLVHHIRTDEFIITENLASEDKIKHYETLILGDEEQIRYQGKTSNSMYFIKKMLYSFIYLLQESEVKFSKMALDLSDSKILAWVELFDDDEKSEDNLIISEAKVNAEFEKFGFKISTTYVEASDNLNIPTHYSLLNSNILNP